MSRAAVKIRSPGRARMRATLGSCPDQRHSHGGESALTPRRRSHRAARAPLCRSIAAADSDGQRSFRRNAGADPTVFLTGNGFVQLERVTPENLAPESVVTENLPAVLQQLLGVAASRIVKGLAGSLSRERSYARAKGKAEAESSAKANPRVQS